MRLLLLLIIICINNLFSYNQFKSWAEKNQFNIDNIINDKTNSNDERLGAVGDLMLAINTYRELIGNKDLIIIPADTMFYEDFTLSNFISNTPNDMSGLIAYKLADTAPTNRYGIIEVYKNKFRLIIIIILQNF